MRRRWHGCARAGCSSRRRRNARHQCWAALPDATLDHVAFAADDLTGAERLIAAKPLFEDRDRASSGCPPACRRDCPRHGASRHVVVPDASGRAVARDAARVRCVRWRSCRFRRPVSGSTSSTWTLLAARRRRRLRPDTRRSRSGTGEGVTAFIDIHERPLHFLSSAAISHASSICTPKPQDGGRFSLRHDLPAGEYMLIADFLPAAGTSQFVQRAVVTPGYRARSSRRCRRSTAVARRNRSPAACASGSIAGTGCAHGASRLFAFISPTLDSGFPSPISSRTLAPLANALRKQDLSAGDARSSGRGVDARGRRSRSVRSFRRRALQDVGAVSARRQGQTASFVVSVPNRERKRARAERLGADGRAGWHDQRNAQPISGRDRPDRSRESSRRSPACRREDSPRCRWSLSVEHRPDGEQRAFGARLLAARECDIPCASRLTDRCRAASKSPAWPSRSASVPRGAPPSAQATTSAISNADSDGSLLKSP